MSAFSSRRRAVVDLHRHSTRQAEEYTNMAEIRSNPAWNDLYSRLKNLTNAKNNEEDEEDTWRLWHLEDIPAVLKPELKENWKEIHEEIDNRNGQWPMLYLTSVKMHHPDKFLLAIDKIGNRLWKDELSTIGGENIVDCGREIGLELEESLYIDRNMVKMWQELINSSREFLAMEYYEHNKPKIEQGKRSPMFLFPTEISEIVIFQDWNQCPQKYFRERKNTNVQNNIL